VQKEIFHENLRIGTLNANYIFVSIIKSNLAILFVDNYIVAGDLKKNLIAYFEEDFYYGFRFNGRTTTYPTKRS